MCIGKYVVESNLSLALYSFNGGVCVCVLTIGDITTAHTLERHCLAVFPGSPMVFDTVGLHLVLYKHR